MHNDWSRQTVAILASGPSITATTAHYARQHADRVITINETWRLCIGADVLYAADADWWLARGPTPDEFTGQHWTQNIGWNREKEKPPHIRVAQSRPGTQITRDGAIALGNNSSFQAMSLAVKWGADKIVFLGLDMCNPNGVTHWHGDHPKELRNTKDAAFVNFRKVFQQSAPVLQELGVEVINTSLRSALECFPKMRLEDALPPR